MPEIPKTNWIKILDPVETSTMEIKKNKLWLMGVECKFMITNNGNHNNLWICADEYETITKYPLSTTKERNKKTYEEIKQTDEIITESIEKSEGKYINLHGMLDLIFRTGKKELNMFGDEMLEKIYPSIIRNGYYNKSDQENIILKNGYEKYAGKPVIYIAYIGSYKIGDKFYDHYKYGSNDYINDDNKTNNKYELNKTVYMVICEKNEEIKWLLTNELKQLGVTTTSNDIEDKEEIFIITHKFDMTDAKELINKLINTKQYEKLKILETEIMKIGYELEIMKYDIELKKYELEMKKYELQTKKNFHVCNSDEKHHNET